MVGLLANFAIEEKTVELYMSVNNMDDYFHPGKCILDKYAGALFSNIKLGMSAC